MPYSNAKRKQLAAARRRGLVGSVGSTSVSGGRRPATTATNTNTIITTSTITTTTATTEDSTPNGNVNNNGRGFANASNAKTAKRINNRSRSNSSATTAPRALKGRGQQGGVRTSKNTNIEDEEEEDPEDLEEDGGSSSAEDEEEELVSRLSVAGVGSGDGPSPAVLSESSDDGSVVSERVTSEEEEPPSEDCKSFFVIVNTDGSLVLDNTKQLQLDEGQERFAISLPTNKIKSLENPLPGAITVPTPRARKSKPEGVTYGGSSDVGFIGIPAIQTPTASTSSTTIRPEIIEIDLVGSKEASMSVGINAAHVVQPSLASGSTGQIDMDEFTQQLDPQSLATLNTLIDSEEGMKLMENMDLNQVSNVNVGGTGVVEPKPPGWDQNHSYTTGKNSTRRDSSVSSSASSVANSPGGLRNPGRSTGTGRPSSTGLGRPSSCSRLSEGDGNIRRSLRQQDRIERQEAERILAENQQMLQREKEIMKEASAQKVASPVGIADSLQGTSPISPVAKVAVTPASVLRVASPSPSLTASVGDSRASPESDSRRPYPKRENRKLPAHLADPNYVSLEDEGSKTSKDGTSPEKIGIVGGSRRSSAQTKPDEYDEEVEDEGIDNAGGSADDDDEDYTEDDPNRLWCICRQPHNNRFMICCDKCEEWFHGKCVNVTKAQGKAMELKNVSWNCPPCRKLLNERAKKAAETSQNRGRAISRRESDSVGRSSVKLSKAAVAQQAEAAAAANAAKLAQTPEKIAAQSIAGPRRVIVRKSEMEKKSGEESNVHNCVVCGKPSSRKDSIYCSDQCVQKYAVSIGTKSTNASIIEKAKTGTASLQPQPSTPTTPTSATVGKDKLKRTNSLKVEPKSDIFAFHVITSGSMKSTEVVPPKPKELTASQLLKAQREQAAIAAAVAASPATSPIKMLAASVAVSPGTSSHPTVQGVSPNSVNAIMSSTPTVVVKKMTTADGKSFVKLPGRISKESPLKIDTSNASDKGKAKEKESVTSPTKTRARAGSASTSTSEGKGTLNRKASLKSTEKEKEPVKDRDGMLSEKLQRETMRKSFRELLKTRIKEMTEEEQRKIAGGNNTPEVVAEKIEEELTRVHGGASNPKCRAKYRSIFFNLKDSKNCLYQELLQGNLKPRVLVKMEPHELASAELSEWRKRETEKELDAIKKSELDKYAEAKKIQLLEKGVDDAVTVAEESRPLHISDIIDSNTVGNDSGESTEKSGSSGEKSKSSSSNSHGHHTKGRGKDSSKLSEKEKDRDRRDSRRRSDRHKAEKDRESSSKEKDRRTREKEKESLKVKHSDSRDRDRKHSKGKESDRHKSVTSKEDSSKSPTDSGHKKSSDNEITTPTETSTSGDGTPSYLATPTDSKKNDVRHSTDSEQELPSSTIKTPDFTDEASLVKKDSDSKPMFQTRIIMPELGGFNASAHAVSHFSTDGLVFPESPVPIVGRISPETVWDYINKMKKSKEVIVFRLSPATPEDSEGYMTFFSYFSSRGRLAVLGGIISPLKDVYLVPLDKHSPVNRSLQPFRGPGLPKERTHCLLCVVTRHIQGEVSIPLTIKRKSTVPVQLAAASKKKVKLGVEKPKSKLSRPTSSNVSDKLAVSTPSTGKVEAKEDDDAPYTPWEEEDEKEEDKKIPNADKEDPLLLLKAPVTNSQPVDVQKQLQELEDKIAKERQDIEKITGALAGRNPMSGIPGLDGEFPEENEGAKKKDIPFFLRQSAVESQEKKVRVLSGGMPLPAIDVQDSGTEISSQESMDICIVSSSVVPDTPSDVIIEDSSSNSKDSDSCQVVDTAGEDAEEAYSPSAMQFSDDETPVVEQATSKSMKSQSPDIIIEEQKPSASGTEASGSKRKQLGKFVAAMEPVDDIKIVMKKPAVTTQVLSPSTISGSPVKVKRDFIDLGDDLEPLPPGEILSPLVPAVSKKPDPVFEKAGTVFAKSLAVASTAYSKKKININLITKQLPSKDNSQEKKKESPEIVKVPTDKASQMLTASCNQPPILFPTHLPPPNLQHNLPNMCPVLPNLQQPPPGLQQLPNQPQTLPHIPVHIPPPNMKPVVVPTVPTSVVINLNVPPPPLMSMMTRPMPPVPSMGFPPLPRPPMAGFPNVPPPPMTMRPNQRPPFVPPFSEAANIDPRSLSGIPGKSGPSIDRDPRSGKREFDGVSPDVERVVRINLDLDNSRRDRDRSERNIRGRDGRNFGRRPAGRDTSDRVRRNRTRSRSNDRDRSKSRERRHRRRHSKSRSKSPVSKRREARNKSRSRSPGKRVGRHRSRSASPSRRHRRSGSPRKNAKNIESNSRSKSPATPKARHSSASEKNAKSVNEDEDWEAPVRTEASVEKQTSVSSSESIVPTDTV